MHHLRGAVVGGILAVVLSAPATGGISGQPTGWGWCPICGRDMPASHFPHR